MVENYYTILQVPQSATQRDIKLAYRKLVQAHHPDVNNTNDNDDLIKQINLAYDTLAKPKKRAIYDRGLLSNYPSGQTDFYNSPTPQQPRRKPPPHFYQKTAEQQTQPTYTLKIQIIGWSATVLALILIAVSIITLHYYSSEYYYNKGVEAESLNNYTEALNFYKEAIRDFGKKSVEASIRSAELSENFNSYQYMADFCQKGLTYNPDSLQSALLFFLEGKAYTHTNRLIKAESAFLKSLSYNYNKDTIYTHLALLYVNHLGEYQKAADCYSFLLSGNAINIANYYNRGICYQYLDKHNKAIEDFEKVLTSNPLHANTLFQLGRSHLALGNKQVACNYLHLSVLQGINIDPMDLAKACE